MDYLDEMAGQSAEIRLAGQAHTVPRARLGKHFALARLEESPEPDRILRYLTLATGLSESVLEAATLDELLAAYQTLRDLNRLHGVFPFMVGSGQRDPLDYGGRSLAHIVHRLASAYGWSREAILNLQPEEALFYLLEILVDRHEERAWQYGISGVGFDKDGRKIPYPRLAWRWDQSLAQPTAPRINREKALAAGLIPLGPIIDGIGVN